MTEKRKAPEKRKTVSLCLLVMNERKGCEHDVPLIPRDQFDEIFAVDSNSTDGTEEFLKANGIHVYQQPEKGYSAALHYGFRMCKSNALVVFSPTGRVPIEDTLKFRACFDAGAELVIANRNMKGARNEEDVHFFRPRKWFVLGLSLMTALLWQREGPVVLDVLHGFRGMTVKAFNHIGAQDLGVSIDLEMVTRAYKLGLTIVQFPTSETGRIHGSTHFPALKTGSRLLLYLWREIRRRD
jgi:GTP:adenosylcobinamide-phosphate guanylyltransferase